MKVLNVKLDWIPIVNINVFQYLSESIATSNTEKQEELQVFEKCSLYKSVTFEDAIEPKVIVHILQY